MRVEYGVYGFLPRSQGEHVGRNDVLRWAQGIGPAGFNARRGTARARWEVPYRSGDGTISYTDHYLLLPFQCMGTRIVSHGWVVTNHRTGTNTHLSETIDVMFIDAIRCLPDQDQPMRAWGYQRENARQWLIVQGYNRQYNLTLRARLEARNVPSEAHRQAVRDMHTQGLNLIYEAALELASPANVPTGTLLRRGNVIM